MKRRQFLFSVCASAATPWLAGAADRKPPRDLKVTGVEVLVTNPDQKPNGNLVLVKVKTNQPGLYGWGDATCTGSELVKA